MRNQMVLLLLRVDQIKLHDLKLLPLGKFLQAGVAEANKVVTPVKVPVIDLDPEVPGPVSGAELGAVHGDGGPVGGGRVPDPLRPVDQGPGLVIVGPVDAVEGVALTEQILLVQALSRQI